jgi:flavin-dependent dehydrogenase
VADLEEAEVIVVGGGPAGAAAAWELTRNGIDTLVLDLAQFPREKLCAGWITPEVVSDLELNIADYPHRFLTFDSLRVAMRGMDFTLHSPQHSIRRYEFDDWLLKRSGARILTHQVRDIRRDRDGYVLDEHFRCRYLIGAAGTRCPVYRSLFRTSHGRNKALQLVTQELEFPLNQASADCHLWFFDDGLPGYSWYVPKENGYINVGVGAVAAKLKARGDGIKRHWDLLCQRLLDHSLLDQAPAQPGGYSYYLRERRQRTWQQDNVYLAGDAAGLATRDMCEGIGPAISSGLMAARSILGRQKYDLRDISRHTLNNPLLHLGLDFALTRLRA